MKNKLQTKLIVTGFILCLVLSIPLYSAENANQTRELNTEIFKENILGNPVEIVSYIRGKYTSLEIVDKAIIINCKKGDISLRGICVDDDLIGPFFEFYFNNQVSFIKISDCSNFKGVYKNGYIRGRIIGDIIIQ